jgi:hypothetical protein
MALLLTFARGPWENGWVGWHGGLSIKKKNKTSADGKDEEPRNHLRRMSTNEPRPVGVEANNGDIDLEKNELGAAQAAVVRDLEKESRSGVDDGKELDVEKASAKSDEDGLTPVSKETT